MCDVSDLIGKPWANKGRGPDVYDCWGLAMEVCARFGRAIPDYGINALAAQMINKTYACLLGDAEIGAGPWDIIFRPEPGDIVAFKNADSIVSHVGVFLGNGLFTHVQADIRVSIERVNAIEWKNRVAGYYRYVG